MGMFAALAFRTLARANNRCRGNVNTLEQDRFNRAADKGYDFGTGGLGSAMYESEIHSENWLC